MHVAQQVYRELHESLLVYKGDSLYPNVLVPWLDANLEERRWLSAFASRRGSPVPTAEVEDLWRLYALSRVNDILLTRFEHLVTDESNGTDSSSSQSEYLKFADALGFSVAQVSSFSPFYHEVVEVERADDDMAPVSLMSHLWPCLMLGDMLFSRAGVRVCGGSTIIKKDVAESSTLYWAYRRKRRPHQDLSHGWGSNSQWRTAFRRDYQVGQGLRYNVDGKRRLGSSELPPEDDELTLNERIELLTNRCFIFTTKPHVDLWPYDDMLYVAT